MPCVSHHTRNTFITSSPKWVDRLHGDATGLGFGEGAGGIAVEGGPGFFVYFGLESGLEVAVGGVRAKKVGVANEEAFFVVVGVDESTGDIIGAVVADLVSVGMENVYVMNRDLCLVVRGRHIAVLHQHRRLLSLKGYAAEG